jgi:hypothetical protein
MLKKVKRVHPIAFRLGLQVYWQQEANPFFFSNTFRFNLFMKGAILG